MKDSTPVIIEISNTVSEDDRNALLGALHQDLEVAESSMKRFGVDWTMVICALKEGATIAGGAAALANLADTLIRWRRAMRKRGASCEVAVKAQNSSRIDLESCEDEEITNTFTEKK